jgi:hypothetical protein
MTTNRKGNTIMKRILITAASILALTGTANASQWWVVDFAFGVVSDCDQSAISPLESANLDPDRTLVDKGVAVSIEKEGRTIFLYFRNEADCLSFNKIWMEKWRAANKALDKYR